MFWRKKPTLSDPEFGLLVYANGEWSLQSLRSPVGEVLVSIAGDRSMPITRSAVSQHLQVLKSVGLVSDRAVGTRRVYAVDPDALAVLRAYFDAFWTRSLSAFADAAHERPEGT